MLNSSDSTDLSVLKNDIVLEYFLIILFSDIHTDILIDLTKRVLNIFYL